ncbi:MAG: DNA polymerase III subunit delta [Firmicutes bacterium]|nr:DNA polymerase III subunit delta [Bacillota bacterium]
MTFLEFEEHFAKGTLEACYAIKGDGYFVSRITKKFESLVGDFSDINFVKFAESGSVQKVVDECQTLPFASAYKVVVADFTFLSGDSDLVKKYLQNPNPAIILVLFNTGTRLTSGLVTVDCDKNAENILCDLVTKECVKHGATITTGVAKGLLLRCGFDMQRVHNEIKKLAAYAKADGSESVRPITAAGIDCLVSPSIESNVFALTDAVGKKDNGRALKIYQELVTSGQEPLALNGLLYAHFRRLLFCKLLSVQSVDSIAALMGVKPYAVTLAKQSAALYTAGALTKICKKFWSMDDAIRTGKMTMANSTQTLIFEIMQIA